MRRFIRRLFGKARTIRTARPEAPRARLGMLTFEDRLMPSAVTGTFDHDGDRVLRIDGTSLADTITVFRQQGATWVVANGQAVGLNTGTAGTWGSVPYGLLAGIEIDGFDGGDTIEVRTIHVTGNNPNAVGTEAMNYAVPVDINAGNGNDTVRADVQTGAVNPYALPYTTNPAEVQAGDGYDVVYGGGAADYLHGGVGDDFLAGGGGDDELQGGDDNDYLMGDGGADYVHAGYGNDTALGGGGDDEIYGYYGNDSLYGEANADYVHAGDGDDMVSAGDHDDSVVGSQGNDTVWGGSGNDTVSAGTGTNTVYGGAGNDSIYADSGADKLYGEGDHDTLLGYGGNDTLDGSSGNDSIAGYDGADSILAGSGNDTVSAGTGLNTVYGGSGHDSMWGDTGDDLIYGEGDNDTLTGYGGHDTLYGGSGNDTLYGQDGRDGLFGGAGSNYLHGGSGADRFLDWDGGTNNLADDGSADAVIRFEKQAAMEYKGTQHTAGDWTEEEILRFDPAFAMMQHRTGNATLLKKSDGSQIVLRRLGGENGVAGAWNSGGVLYFPDNRFDDGDEALQGVVLHEVGHNWDLEHGGWADFLDISDWTQTDPNSAAFTRIDKYGETWWFRTNSEFYTDYAKTHPKDDFAESFEGTILGNTADIEEKAAHINDWLDSISG